METYRKEILFLNMNWLKIQDLREFNRMTFFLYFQKKAKKL